MFNEIDLKTAQECLGVLQSTLPLAQLEEFSVELSGLAEFLHQASEMFEEQKQELQEGIHP